jgi:Leu/Phe-tRNA-protein transferase
METAHLASFGAREIPRREFSEMLVSLVRASAVPGPWTIEAE